MGEGCFSPGGGPSVSSITLCTVIVGSGCLPGLRVLSRVRPAMPSNRACPLALIFHIFFFFFLNFLSRG